MVPDIARPTIAEQVKTAADGARERQARAVGDSLAALLRGLLRPTPARAPVRPQVSLPKP